jgi:hypothetical protein
MKYLKCFENVVESYQCNLDDLKTNIKVSSPILQMLFFKFSNNNLPGNRKNQRQKIFVVVKLHSYCLARPPPPLQNSLCAIPTYACIIWTRPTSVLQQNIAHVCVYPNQSHDNLIYYNIHYIRWRTTRLIDEHCLQWKIYRKRLYIVSLYITQ